VLEQLPPHARLTLTWDQGCEMARHDLLARFFTDGIYFAHPASPWLRGTNENTNGLLRQYWPKGSDLSVITDDQLSTVQARLNERPRKILNWKTPAEVFAASLRSW
jgi:IS30 family transposase